MDHELTQTRERVTLLDLVDRALDKGVVISGDITLSVADVDLVYVGLRALLASVGTLEGSDREADRELRRGLLVNETRASQAGGRRAPPVRDH